MNALAAIANKKIERFKKTLMNHLGYIAIVKVEERNTNSNIFIGKTNPTFDFHLHCLINHLERLDVDMMDIELVKLEDDMLRTLGGGSDFTYQYHAVNCYTEANMLKMRFDGCIVHETDYDGMLKLIELYKQSILDELKKNLETYSFYDDEYDVFKPETYTY